MLPKAPGLVGSQLWRPEYGTFELAFTFGPPFWAGPGGCAWLRILRCTGILHVSRAHLAPHISDATLRQRLRL